MHLGSFRRSLFSALIAIAASPLAGCGSSADETVPPPADGLTTPAEPTPTPPAATPATPAPTTPAPVTFDPTTQITSGEDITVDSVELVSPRTFDVFVTTPNISPKVLMSGKNAVRVTVPADYATSGKRYPVIYFLHGATCNYKTASEIIGIENRASLDDSIIVMPEAGKFGFYTDWVDQSIAQKWESFHLTQLVPFIDRNLRTIAAKEGRGIIGFSMGGLGAMRYAVDRPELFAAASTLSGIVDLNHGAVQVGITAMLANAKLNANGPFGMIGTSPVWSKVNPASRAKRLADVQVFIAFGAGKDIAEATTASASAVLHHDLEAAKIPHYYNDFGVPGDTAEGHCNGGHTNDCARYGAADVLPRLRAVLANPR